MDSRLRTDDDAAYASLGPTAPAAISISPNKKKLAELITIKSACMGKGVGRQGQREEDALEERFQGGVEDAGEKQPHQQEQPTPESQPRQRGDKGGTAP